MATPQSAPASKASRRDGGRSQEEGRELLQSIVDFTETVVREVMTPRPDIVAIRAETRRSQDLRTLFAGRAVFAHSGLSREPRQHRRHRVREGSRGAAARRRAAADDR